MFADREKTALSVEEQVHAKFLGLAKSFRGVQMDDLLATVGVYKKPRESFFGKDQYFWVYDQETGETIDEIIYNKKISGLFAFMVGQGMNIWDSHGDMNISLSLFLTKFIHKHPDDFASVMKRWRCENVSNLKIATFECSDSYFSKF